MRLPLRAHGLFVCTAALVGGQPAFSQTLRPRPPVMSTGEFGLQASDLLNVVAADVRIVIEAGKDPPTKEQLSTIEDGLHSVIDFATANPRGFLKALRWQRDYPELAKEAATSSDIAKKAAWASIALNEEVFGALVEKLPRTDVRRQRLELAAKEIRRLVRRLLPPDLIISLYADANLRGAFEGDSGDARAGTGAFGLALQKGEASLAFSAVVASSVDTVDANPGPLILSPGTGKGRLSSFQLDLRSPHLRIGWKDRKLRMVGLHSYLSGSNSIWTGVNTSGVRLTDNATVLGLGLLAYHDIARTQFLNTDIALSAEIGWSVRWVKGNAGADDSLRLAVLRTTESSFSGPELGFQVNAGAVAVGVQYYIYSDRDGDARVPDLTNGQLIIGIGITGNVLRGPAGRAEPDE